MNRNTVLAIVLATIVIIAGTFIQATFFSSPVENTVTETEVEQTVVADVPSGYGVDFTAYGNNPANSTFDIENDVMKITFDTKGATVSSVILKNHKLNGEPSQFIYKEEGDVNPYMLYSADDRTSAIDPEFNYTISESANSAITQIRFYRDFITTDGKEFTIEKIFAVPANDEYMIQMVVNIKTADGSSIPLSENSSMYSIYFGPQIGPEFEEINTSYGDYRRVNILRADKGGVSNVKYSDNAYVYDNLEKEDEYLDWIDLTGKYFTLIAIPENKQSIKEYTTTLESKEEGIIQKNDIYITRSSSSSSSVTDVYSFYMGPQDAGELSRYDSEDENVFGLKDHRLKESMSSSWLSWLEKILGFCLSVIYKVIPNYGIAIIVMTIVIKLLIHPLTKRSQDSTARMSALAPKINEIKERYPDDPQAQNTAMAKLYKEENIKPMSSCWPMLIQFPILIAFYGLLSKNIELRGAMFIPGWITDLSAPETIFTLPFRIPLLGNEIHLLPIIYTVSMIFSMKLSQSATSGVGQSSGMLNFMTYGMPIIFFFILYNAPSGLLVYWTVMNIITMGTQLYVNKKKGTKYKEEFQKQQEEKRLARKKRNRR